MSEFYPDKPQMTPEVAEFSQVYQDYTSWLPDEEVGYCGFNRIPLEYYVGSDDPNAETINAAEYLRIQRSYMDYVVTLPPDKAQIAAKHLLHIDDWKTVLQELEAGIAQ